MGTGRDGKGSWAVRLPACAATGDCGAAALVCCQGLGPAPLQKRPVHSEPRKGKLKEADYVTNASCDSPDTLSAGDL